MVAPTGVAKPATIVIAGKPLYGLRRLLLPELGELPTAVFSPCSTGYTSTSKGVPPLLPSALVTRVMTTLSRSPLV
ncbi:Uncharacterised protein [Mycobacteroides abscessus subsp. abscessus]|nr:Uncharacterised protein [Mycobacteroides abscessus subsp. abscessus]